MSDTVNERYSARLVEQASLYAKADNSDPFTLVRCLSHIRQGLCGRCDEPDMPWTDVVQHGKRTKLVTVKIGPEAGSDGHYSATPFPEKRLTADGSEYLVTVYRNRARP